MASQISHETLIGRRVLASALANYAGKITTLVLGFLLTPFILSQIGVTAFGLWALLSSFVGYGSLLDLGITGAVVKYVSEYRATDRMHHAHSLVATALRLYSALGAAVVILFALVAPFFPEWFRIDPAQRATASWLVFLMGLALGIQIPGNTLSAVLRGLQRFDLVNLIGVFGSLISMISIVVVLLMGFGLVGLVAVAIPVTIAMQVVSVLIIRRAAPELRLGLDGASRRFVRTIFSFSASLFVQDLAGRLQTRSDELVIAGFLPVAAVTPFSLARRLGEMAQILTDQFLKVIFPLASELAASRDYTRLRALYTAGTRLTLAVFTPIACALIIFARETLVAWVGPGYAQYWNLVVILTVSTMIVTSQWPASSVLQGMARHRVLGVSALVTGIANILLSIALVKPLGLAGVALGTLIPFTLECFGFVLPYTMHVLRVSPRVAVREILLPAAIPALPTIAVYLLLQQAFAPSSLIALAAVGSVGAAVYAAIYLLAGASRLERETYWHFALTTLKTARSRLNLS